MNSLVFGIVPFSSSSWPSWFWIEFKGPRDPYACAYGFFKRLDCLEVFPLSHFHDHHEFWFWCKTQNLKVFNIIDLTFSSLLSWFRIQRHLVQLIFCWRFIIYYVVICVYVLCITRWLWWVVMLLQNIQQFWIGTIHNVLLKPWQLIFKRGLKTRRCHL